MILVPSTLHDLLSQLTSPTGIPHTSILTLGGGGTKRSGGGGGGGGGSILSYDSIPPRDFIEPFREDELQSRSRSSLERRGIDEEEEEEEEEGQDEEEVRIGRYAALAVGTWNEQRNVDDSTTTTSSNEPLTLETEVGRMTVMGVADDRFLIILVGTSISPWKVLDTKIRAAEEYLREPLSKIST